LKSRKKIDVRTNVVFEHLLESDKRFIIQQGGTRSGKTYNILLWLIFIYCMRNTGKTITIVRRSGTALRGSVMRDFFAIIQEHEIYDVNHHNKTNNEYRLNGNLIEFVSLDEPQKIRGRKRNMLFINEGNELDHEDFFQLNVRTTERVIVDFNPSDEYHWLYDKVIPRDDADFHITTYRDNPFLEQSVIDEIERLRETDSVYWRIYGEGQRAQGRATIFQFTETDVIPEHAKLIAYGLDWGYVNDPTAMVAVYQLDNEIILDELLYRTGMTNDEIVREIKAMDIGNFPIYADSAEPKSIDEINKRGINIKAATKGRDSVNIGIDMMRRYKLKWTTQSSNGIKEMRAYKWMEDKNGKLLNTPVDAHNHLIDSARYAITMVFKNPNYGKYIIG
jgi:phage terminase large subunit